MGQFKRILPVPTHVPEEHLRKLRIAARTIIRRYPKTLHTYEDLITLGWLRSVCYFPEGKFYWRKIYRTLAIECSTFSRSELPGDYCTPYLRYHAMGTTYEVENRDELSVRLQRLPPDKRRLLWQHAAGRSIKEIADRRGVSRQAVNQQRLAALDIVRK